jgi:hypothetical protein
MTADQSRPRRTAADAEAAAPEESGAAPAAEAPAGTPIAELSHEELERFRAQLVRKYH